MSLDNFLMNINISLGANAITRQGFGTVMILCTGLGAGFTERIRFYGSASEAAADTDLSADAISRVSTAFAQNPSPAKVAVGRRDADASQDIDFTVSGFTDGDYSITINNLTHTYTASGAANTGVIVAALVSLINTGVDLGALTLTFTDNGTDPDTIERSTGSWITDGVSEGTEITITGSVSNNGTFTAVNVTGTTLTLSPSATLTDESSVTVTACVAAEPVTATDADPVVQVVASTAGTGFTYASASTGAAIVESVTTANTNVATEAQAVLDASPADWFGLVLNTRSDTDILRVARDFAESANRLFLGQSSSADMITSAQTDIMSDLKRRGLIWSAVAYYSSNTENFDIGWLASFLSNDFDAVAPTASNNTIETIPTEELGSTAQTNLNAKNGSYYTTLKGVGATAGAIVAAGYDMEHVVTAAWMKARMSENIASLFLSVSNGGSRIQYNDLGFQQVASQIGDVLNRAEVIGHTNIGTSEMVVPLRTEVSQGDEAEGILRIQFGAQYSGRVKRVFITGTVSTDFESLTL